MLHTIETSFQKRNKNVTDIVTLPMLSIHEKLNRDASFWLQTKTNHRAQKLDWELMLLSALELFSLNIFSDSSFLTRNYRKIHVGNYMN